MNSGFLSGRGLSIGFSVLIKSITSIWFQKMVATHLCWETSVQSQRGRKMIRQCFKLHTGLFNYYWYKEKCVSFVTKVTTRSRNELCALSWDLKKNVNMKIGHSNNSSNQLSKCRIKTQTCFLQHEMILSFKYYFWDCFKFCSSFSVS